MNQGKALHRFVRKTLLSSQCLCLRLLYTVCCRTSQSIKQSRKVLCQTCLPLTERVTHLRLVRSLSTTVLLQKMMIQTSVHCNTKKNTRDFHSSSSVEKDNLKSEEEDDDGDKKVSNDNDAPTEDSTRSILLDCDYYGQVLHCTNLTKKEKLPRSQRKKRHKKKSTSVEKKDFDVLSPTESASANSRQHQQVQRRPKKKLLSSNNCNDMVWYAAEKAQHTGSVLLNSYESQIESISTTEHALNNNNNNNGQQQHEAVPIPSQRKRTQVITCGYYDLQSPPPFENLSCDNLPSRQIFAQPLLILDMNGILCHRIRHKRSASVALQLPIQQQQQVNVQYRNHTTIIAQTPIVKRPQVETFLRFLDQHFCLAVWTSGQSKTARQLVKFLIPPDIANRLLFVWSQHHCDVQNETHIPSNDRDATSLKEEKGVVIDATMNDNDNISIASTTEKIIFGKNLSKVWNEYPLWNASNTLLLDDSPQKCVQWKWHALHPPGIHGRKMDSLDEYGMMSDDENIAKQQIFFERLVQYWREHTYVQEYDEGGIYNNVEQQHPATLFEFLKDHATEHMGWGKQE